MQTFRKHLHWPKSGKIILVLGLLLVLIGGPVIASSGGAFNLSWWTVDGGGDVSSGGSYAVGGTVGQADGGPALSGGDYSLDGGFWTGVGAGEQMVYLPIMLR